MNFNTHSDFEGKHALLNPSGFHWVNYDVTSDTLLKRYRSLYSQTIGTTLHEYAEKRIKYKLKLRKTDTNDILFYLLDHGIPRSVIDLNHICATVFPYVNDAIGFKMLSEQVLYYSENCFGTTDAIIFRNNLLRIHDLKTGVIPANMGQLEIYAALFCLEYDYKPDEIDMELRIYQSGEVLVHVPETDYIYHVMDKIVTLDKAIREFILEGG